MLSDPSPFLYEGTKLLIAAIGEAVSEKSIDELKRQINNIRKKHSKPAKHENEDAQTVSIALLRMQRGGVLPQIAIVGMTSAGKSMLTNALFGSPLSEVKITPDTTDGVLRIGYQSGLVIYDTPGFFGDEKFPNHNITRLFLRLKEDSDYPSPAAIPLRTFQYGDSKIAATDYIAPDNVKKHAPITTVLWVIDASRTLSVMDKKVFRALFKDLESEYKGRLIVAGTHLDILKKVSFDEREEMLKQWTDVSNGQLIPISSVTGEGLDKLVLTLFSSLPDSTSFAKLQASLITARRLNRISFVLTETSKMLAAIMLLDGAHLEDIQITSITMFTLICNHYAIDEETWRKYSGDAIQIGKEVQTVGASKVKKLRNPKGFFERLRFVFGTQFFEAATEFRELGVDGLKKLLPKVYLTIYDFEGDSLEAALSEEQIRQIIQGEKPYLEALIQKKNAERLTIAINQLLISLFETL